MCKIKKNKKFSLYLDNMMVFLRTSWELIKSQQEIKWTQQSKAQAIQQKDVNIFALLTENLWMLRSKGCVKSSWK